MNSKDVTMDTTSLRLWRSIHAWRAAMVFLTIGFAHATAAAAQETNAKAALEEAAKFNRLGAAFYNAGKYAEAEPLHLRSLAIRERVLGPHHPDVALSLNNLAGVYRAQAQFAKAESFYLRALTLREKSLGAEHPAVAASLNGLAWTYYELNQYSKAEPLYDRALAIRERVLGRDHLDVAATLNDLAVLYAAQGQYTKAEALYERSLAINEKAYGPDHPAVATRLANLASLYQTKGEYGKVEPLYERALAIREKVYGADHPNVARTLTGLAMFYRLKGEYAKAERLFERSLAVREKAFGPHHPSVAASLDGLASVYYEQNLYAKAEPLYDRALAIREKSLGPEHLSVADSLADLAGLYTAQGRYSEAERLYQRSLIITEKIRGPDHPAIARRLGRLAMLYRIQGQYEKAERLTQRSLTIRENAFGPDNPSVAGGLNALGTIYRMQGQFAKAEPLYQRALAIREKAFGPVHPDVAATLNNLAVVYVGRGQYAKGEALHHRALAIREKLLGHEHRDIADSLGDLAIVYRWQGQFEKAEPLFLRSLIIREKIFGPDHPEVARGLEQLGVVYRAQRHYARAESLFLRSLSIREKAFGTGHPSVAHSLRSLAMVYRAQGRYLEAEPIFLRALTTYENSVGQEYPNIASTLNELAFVYESLGQYEKVLPLLNRALQIASGAHVPSVLWETQNSLRRNLARARQVDLAIFFGKQAVNTIQLLRANLTSQDSETDASFLQNKNKTRVYRELADLLIEEGRLPEAQQVLSMLKEEELFEFIRRSESEDHRNTATAFTPTEQAWQKGYQQISGRLGEISRGLEELQAKAKTGLSAEEAARRQQLTVDRRIAQQSFDSFLGDLLREMDAAPAQRNREIGERGLANLRTLQDTLASLGHNAVTLHYLMGENKLRMILTTPTLQIARESAITAVDLNRKIQEFRTALSNPRSNPVSLGQELFRHLIAPVALDLEQAKAQTLMVSLDGAMRYIPLAALHDGKKYLLEQYRIVVYTEAAKDKLKDAPVNQWRAAGLGLTRTIEGFSRLPAVRQEIEGIIISGNRGVLPGEAHFDLDFTANKLREAVDKSFPVLHIASHFVFRPGDESKSFLLLGDGHQLSLRDIKEEDIRFRGVDLITLSACDTAVGGGNDGNGLEIEGFGALAQKQGAKSVIATLWQVTDESTAILMQDFYRARQENAGMTKLQALREAQLKLVRSGSGSLYTHPYYWAAFILMGNWL